MKTPTNDAPSRLRFQKALNFDKPDAIPVIYHPSPSGLFKHGTALLDLFNEYPPDNAVTFDGIPQPNPEHYDQAGNYYRQQTDIWGTTWAYRIYGIEGHVHKRPIHSWEEALANYQFPSIELPNSDTERQIKCDIAAKKQDRYVIGGWILLFDQMHRLYPMEELLMDLVTGDPLCLKFLDRLEAHWQKMIEHLIRTGVDAVMFGDDWGTQRGPIVSPELFREHFLPRYQRLIALLRQAGCHAFFHSCGRLDSILDDSLALDIDVIWPQLPVYDEQELADKCHQAGVTLYLHLDRQRLIPRGTPEEIEQTVARYAKRYHEMGGGGIFYIEIESDTPYENVKTLIQSVDRHRWRD